MIRLPESEYSKYEIVDFISLAEKKRRRNFKRIIICNIIGIALLITILLTQWINQAS